MNTLFNNLTNRLNDYILLLTRVVVGYMFLLHGTAKFFEFPVSMTGGNGAVPLLSVFGVGGALEIIGGALLMMGLFTRFNAFIMAGMMAVAYFGFHSGFAQILDPISNQGEAAALYCMVFLLFWLNGAGKFSLDNKLYKA